MKRTLLAIAVLLFAAGGRAAAPDPNDASVSGTASGKQAGGKEKLSAAAADLDAAADAVLGAKAAVDSDEMMGKFVPAKAAKKQQDMDNLRNVLLTQYGPALSRFNAALATFSDKSGAAVTPSAGKPAAKSAASWSEIDQAASGTISQGCPSASATQKQLTKLCNQLGEKHKQIAAVMGSLGNSAPALQKAAAAEESAKADMAKAKAVVQRPEFNKMVKGMDDKDLAKLFTGANPNAHLTEAELKAKVADIKNNPSAYYGIGEGKVNLEWAQAPSEKVDGTARARMLMAQVDGQQIKMKVTGDKNFNLNAETGKNVAALLAEGKTAKAGATAGMAAIISTANLPAAAAAVTKNPGSAVLPQLMTPKQSAEEALKIDEVKEARRHMDARKSIEEREKKELDKEFQDATKVGIKVAKPCVSGPPEKPVLDEACVMAKFKESKESPEIVKRIEKTQAEFQKKMEAEDAKNKDREAGLDTKVANGAASAEKAVHDRLDLMKPDSKEVKEYFSGPDAQAREQRIVKQCGGASLSRGLFGWGGLVVDDDKVADCVHKAVKDGMANKQPAAPQSSTDIAYVPKNKRPADPAAGQFNPLGSPLGDTIKRDFADLAKPAEAHDVAWNAASWCPTRLFAWNHAGGIQPFSCMSTCPPGTVRIPANPEVLGPGNWFCDDGSHGKN